MKTNKEFVKRIITKLTNKKFVKRIIVTVQLTNKEFVKRLIATVQLKTLIILLKVQASAKLTDKEKDVQKEVNELIPEIYTDEDLKRIISELLLESKELKKMLIRLTNYSSIALSKTSVRYTLASKANKTYKTIIVILSIALLVSILGIIFVLLF